MNEELFYYLGYSGEKIQRLLRAVDENKLLTLEQYDKLINQIGLDNISTFDLDYNKLKNAPGEYPRRVSAYINDCSYISESTLKDELKLLKYDIDSKISELEISLDKLNTLDVDLLLDKVSIAEDSLESFKNQLSMYNDTLFSMSRTVETYTDKTTELEKDLIEFKLIQDSNESLLNVVHQLADTNHNEIQILNDIINSEIDKLIELKNSIDAVMISINEMTQDHSFLYDYVLYFNAAIQEANDSIKEETGEDPDFISLSLVELLEYLINKKVNNDHGAIYNEIDNLKIKSDELVKSIEELSKMNGGNFEELDSRINEVYKTTKDYIQLYENLINKITNIETTINVLNNDVSQIANALKEDIQENKDLISKNSNEINSLKVKDQELVAEISKLKTTDASHIAQIKQLSKDLSNVSTVIQELEKQANEKLAEIIELTTRVMALENAKDSMNESIKKITTDLNIVNTNIHEITKSISEMEETVLKNRNDILTLTSEFEANKKSTNSSIESINNAISTLTSKAGSIDAQVLTLQTKLNSIEEDLKDYVRREVLESLQLQLGETESEDVILINLVLQQQVISTIALPITIGQPEDEESRLAITNKARTDYSVTGSN